MHAILDSVGLVLGLLLSITIAQCCMGAAWAQPVGHGASESRHGRNGIEWCSIFGTRTNIARRNFDDAHVDEEC